MPATPGRFITDASVPGSKLTPDAGISLGQLASGSLILLRDGSIAMTANLNFGNNKGVNVGTPTANNDAANKAYVDTQIASLYSIFDNKGSCRAATTGNINLASPGATHDGVTLTNGQRLFVRAQSAPAENGIYTFNGATSALTRDPLMDNWAEVPGATFTVEEGSVWADTIWYCTANSSGTLGTTAITFQQVNAAGLVLGNFNFEAPSGTINGSNATFTLSKSPASSLILLFHSGVLLLPGTDFTISGSTLTLSGSVPQSGEWLRAFYIS